MAKSKCVCVPQKPWRIFDCSVFPYITPSYVFYDFIRNFELKKNIFYLIQNLLEFWDTLCNINEREMFSFKLIEERCEFL